MPHQNLTLMQLAPIFQMGLTAVLNVALLYVNLVAFRRHWRQSFLLMAFAAICAISYLLGYYLPYFMPGLRPMWNFYYAIATLFHVLQAIVGLWGYLLLLRDYRRLAENAIPPVPAPELHREI